MLQNADAADIFLCNLVPSLFLWWC